MIKLKLFSINIIKIYRIEKNDPWFFISLNYSACKARNSNFLVLSLKTKKNFG